MWSESIHTTLSSQLIVDDHPFSRLRIYPNAAETPIPKSLISLLFLTSGFCQADFIERPDKTQRNKVHGCEEGERAKSPGVGWSRGGIAVHLASVIGKLDWFGEPNDLGGMPIWCDVRTYSIGVSHCARGRRRFACVRNFPLVDRGREGHSVDGRGDEATGRLDTNRRSRLDSRPVSALGPRSGASHQGFRAMLVSFEKTNGWRAQGIADRKT